MCYFLRAVITKYDKLDNLKQQKVTISEFWRPESEIKVLAGPFSRGVKSYLAPFLVSGAGCQFLALLGLELHHTNLCFLGFLSTKSEIFLLSSAILRRYYILCVNLKNFLCNLNSHI